MKVLFDINHPAHFHFFKKPAEILISEGHQVIFTAREKECAVDLFEGSGFIPHVLSSASSGFFGLLTELFVHNYYLWRFVRCYKPDVMVAIGGTFIAHVGLFSRVPSLAFYDTEHAILQNAITYPFLNLLCVPECYQGWLPTNSERYRGYHELSYLAPNRFSPSREVAVRSGVDLTQKNFIVRVVSWQSNHDLNDCGWNEILLSALVDKLQLMGNVIISSERELPSPLASLKYKGLVGDLHHVLAYCDLFVGESATMASECAVLGIPALYVANVGRGYIDDQQKYGLAQFIDGLNYETISTAIDAFLSINRQEVLRRRMKLLDESVDVADYAVKKITGLMKGG